MFNTFKRMKITVCNNEVFCLVDSVEGGVAGVQLDGGQHGVTSGGSGTSGGSSIGGGGKGGSTISGGIGEACPVEAIVGRGQESLSGGGGEEGRGDSLQKL
mgnify:CR=1 FL=1